MEQSETAVTRTPAKGQRPVTIKVTDPRSKQRSKVTRYWFGVTRDAPFAIFTIGRWAFSQYGEHVQVSDEGANAGQVLGNPVRGNFANMTTEDVELITHFVKQAWVKRYKPAKRGCMFFNETSPTGVPDEPDIEPMGHYLYMIPEGGMTASDRDPQGEPPTMVPRS